MRPSSEELAATAEEMSGQAEQLQQAMTFFTLAEGQSAAPAPAKRAPPPAAKQAARGFKTTGNLALSSEQQLEERNFKRF